MPILQSTVSDRRLDMVLGMPWDGLDVREASTAICRGYVKAGYGVFKAKGFGDAGTGTSMADPGECFHQPTPATAAAATAIVASGLASSVASATLLAASANGATGATVMAPGRQLTVVFDSSTDWDTGTASITYISAATGLQVTESITPAHSTTRTTTGYARQFVSFTHAGAAGAGGTATIGVAAMAALTIDDFLGVCQRQPVKNTLSDSSIYNGIPGVGTLSTAADFVENDMVSILVKGGLVVFTEVSVSDRDPVYVRIASGSGGSVLGAFSNVADSATCVRVTGARFHGTASAGKAKVHFEPIW